jgi:hypothetical protein
MTKAANEVYRIISGGTFMAFGYILIGILENEYQLDVVWQLALPTELSAGFWGAFYCFPLITGKPIISSQRLTKALIILAILSALIGLLIFSLAFFGLASLSYACDYYSRLDKHPIYVALTVSFNGLIVAGLSFITGSIIFLLLITPFMEIGLSGLLFLPFNWIMIFGSMVYSGVWLVIPFSILASSTLYFGGLYLREKTDKK